MMEKLLLYLAAKIINGLGDVGFVFLERLELGVSLFCRREAASYHCEIYKLHLRDQAKAEYSHAQILAKSRGDAGYTPYTNLINDERSLTYGTINYGEANASEIDGMSVNYLSGAIFFLF